MKDKKERRPYLKQVNVITTKALTEDGEVYDAQKRVQILQQDDKTFRMMFNEFMMFINSSESLVDVKVFGWITDNLAYNSETIILNKFNKKKIAEATGVSYSSVEKSIGSLVTKQMLIRDDSCARCAAYMVDPSYVWYGDTKSREGRLKFILELIQSNNLPDKEKETIKDIKRYKEWYRANEKAHYDHATGKSKKSSQSGEKVPKNDSQNESMTPQEEYERGEYTVNQ